MNIFKKYIKYVIAIKPSVSNVYDCQWQDLVDVCRREEADGEERNVDRISGLGSSR